MTKVFRRFMPLLLLPLLSAAGCGWSETWENEEPVSLHAAIADTEDISTKGLLDKTIGDAFPVWGYVWPGDGSIGKPNYMCGEIFSKVSSTERTYQSANRHGHVPSGNKLKFWAVTSNTKTWIEASGGNLPSAAVAGKPSFGYTVASEVKDQKDLLAAASTIDCGSTAFPTTTLEFRHILAGIQFFYADEDLPDACTVKSVEITDVYPSGQYSSLEETPHSWIPTGTKRSYKIEKDVPITKVKQPIFTGADSTFILIPQTLGADSRLKVKYELGTGADKRTVNAEASLKDVKLENGKILIFKLVLSDYAVHYTIVTAGQEIIEKPDNYHNVWSSAYRHDDVPEL